MQLVKRTLLLLVAFVIAFSVYATNDSAYADDISGRALEKEMRDMIDRGILLGYGEGIYRPEDNVTRAQFAAFIARALELPDSDSKFIDVPSSLKLAKEISKVKSAGIMTGYSNNSFWPNNNITREEVATTIENVLKYSKMDIIEKRMIFSDQGEFVSSAGVRSVFHAAHYGIVSGYKNEDGTLRFEPKSPATREHAAAFISRYLAAKGDPIPPVDLGLYQLATIKNGKLVKDSKTYANYSDAETLFKNGKFDAMYRGNELVRIQTGIAYSNNFVTNAAGKKVPDVTTMYESYNGTTFRSQIAYIEHGREMRYIDANADAVKVQIGATIGWVKHSEVDFIPLALLQNREYYMKNQYGTLEHYVYNYMSKTGSSYTIGPAAKELQQGVRYYSYDGVHFSNAQGHLIATDYNYFQFLNVRSKTSYTAVELEKFIMDNLAIRERTNLAKYKDATKNSKLIGTAKYMIKMQEEQNVNALFILAAAIHESDYGISDNAKTKNNLFGIKVYDSAPEEGLVFPKPEHSIQSFVLDYMNKNYIPSNAMHANGAAPGNKTSGFNVKYASDPNWGSKIAGHMFRIDIALGKKDIHKEKLIMTSHSANINVRSEPDTTKNNIIFKYPPRILGYANDMGNPLVVVEEKKGADGYTWYKVLSDDPAHTHGWVRSDLVKVISN
ncbi:S-layer homology domain-containing protein [Sporosarcina sp. G11-34]|uniref:S-layer homology domain-containing protein n=1 Tax=Sporosarcina sp. G11-34 TaxID=2849605 RepID=UPI0022A98FCF|nr:S-layer homology domain-containing protein [Sporosarcina sp. G11-34]MCZ2257571.1 S-layer homology domain-containing protein [Sporosarcina sp. G11-34]